MIGRVQKCGCIALPDDLQEQTGLYPGATFEIEVRGGRGRFVEAVGDASAMRPRAWSLLRLNYTKQNE